MPDSKEILDDIERWIQKAKLGETLDLEVFGKKVLMTIVKE